MRRSYLEIVYYKTNSGKSFGAYKKQKIFYRRLFKKIEKRILIHLTRLSLLTINYSGKRLNYSFQKKEIADQKLNFG